MSKLEKLDLMGVASLAVVTAALLVAWMVTTHSGVGSPARHAAQESGVTLSDEGRMKLTVVADGGNASAPARAVRTAAVRLTGGRMLEAALPITFRP